eukprot:3207273-Rhodomonas_salina.1
MLRLCCITLGCCYWLCVRRTLLGSAPSRSAYGAMLCGTDTLRYHRAVLTEAYGAGLCGTTAGVRCKAERY